MRLKEGDEMSLGGLTYHRAKRWAINASTRLWALARLEAQIRAREWWLLGLYAYSRPWEAQKSFRTWSYNRIFCLATVLILLWIPVFKWGEITLFDDAIDQCQWSNWEEWPASASPHHLVFVADPQLVDPHTYPGRPWPLSTLTVKHTDNYLRRSYSRLRRELIPDTVIFLGDLFDGGREWSTESSQSPEKRWRRWGRRAWLKEYDRFSRIFFKDWLASIEGVPESHIVPRILASLPGNHDLGFGAGIQIPVRDRFQAYFGTSNRVDIIANHTFVSVDTVSLSDKDQEGVQPDAEIWGPASAFLDQVQYLRAQALERHFKFPKPVPEHNLQAHEVVDAQLAKSRPIHNKGNITLEADLPTIVLSHVPLFRPPGTPCGPLREKYPPTPPPPGQTEPVEPDERNAIPYAAGYQYQNCLTRSVTSLIVDKLAGTVDYAFSGDDHDYCEVVHKSYPSRGSGIREITVKSISWAMGIRKPGFVMASLWNEVDARGRPLRPGEKTLQTHLCLLPDQLSIIIRYGLLAGFCLAAMFVRAFLVTFIPSKFDSEAQSGEQSLLPSFNQGRFPTSKEKTDMNGHYDGQHAANGMSSASYSEDTAAYSLSARSNAPRNRTGSPHAQYGLGLDPQSQSNDDDKPLLHFLSREVKNHGEWKDAKTLGIRKPKRKQTKAERFLREWVRSSWGVAQVVILYYLWLFRR